MKGKKKSDVAVLLDYAGSRKGLTFLGLTFSAELCTLSAGTLVCMQENWTRRRRNILSRR